MPDYACEHKKCVYRRALMSIKSHLIVILLHRPT